jgi:uracil phosphoribosyltransferase
MLNDSQYRSRPYLLSEIEHRYGPNVHLMNDPYLFTTLAKLGSPECRQPTINQLLNTLYRELVKFVINREFPALDSTIESRMAGLHPEGKFAAALVDPSTKVACVNLARAGTVPSQICFDAFNYILNPEGVRQDHISINRKTDASERVVGTQLGGIKIGGDVNETYVVIPDPMGATGSTIHAAMEIYKTRGTAKKFVAMHLIVTPEYLAHVLPVYPNLVVYAIRLDRGLSPEHVLKTIPGTHWKEERGLNAKHYIIPGAGGLGEVINNSYV